MFAETQKIDMHGTVGTVLYGADANVRVEFYKNAETGLDHIKLFFPGDKNYQPDRPVKDSDKQRWPLQWRAYSENTDQLAGQTRLEELAWINEGNRRTLQAANVYTLEQLAGVPDANLPNIGMGARAMRDRALKELEQKEKLALFDEQNAKMAEMAAKIEALESQAKTARAKRGPGRPRKAAKPTKPAETQAKPDEFLPE